jgi:Arc-like DNA binding dprotein
MKKDSQFTLRIPANLKIQLKEIASSEGRSVAQICEAFLRAGTDTYKKKGNKVIKDFLTRSGKERSG